MSKGGAGKVYFVLYLAVILELLIIFIERDEAEEGLRKQQQQAIEIVQTILSQLQTGSGSSGITVNPKDQIVLDPEKPDNNVRHYEAKVSVGDPKAVMEHNGKTIRGDDIPKLEYIVSYLSDPETPEEELGADTADIEGGTKIFSAELGTDVGTYVDPRQTFGTSVPAPDGTPYFTLDSAKTNDELLKGNRVKVFNLNFKPNQGKGWYRLRLFSQTNKIMGISTGEVHDDDTVRIGNVKLTVKQLKNVQKALAKRRTPGEGPTTVEKYVEKLLEPNSVFPENMATNSFNVRVTEPPAVKPQEPIAAIRTSRDTIYWYSVAPFQIPVKLGPQEGTFSVPGFDIVAVDKENNDYLAVLDNPPVGIQTITAKAVNKVNKAQIDERTLVILQPELRSKWRGLRAIVGRKYNPSSEWKSEAIPDAYYQTEVSMNGSVFSQPGVTFKESDLPTELLVKENSVISTTIYYKPDGINDKTKWVPLLSTDPASTAQIKPGKIDVSYQAPEQADGFTFTWVITPKKFSETFGPIVLKQKTGPGANDYSPVQSAEVDCQDCGTFGVSYRLTQVDDFNWSLVMDADPKKVPATINGKNFDVIINMSGKGGAKNTGYVQIQTKTARK